MKQIIQKAYEYNTQTDILFVQILNNPSLDRYEVIKPERTVIKKE
jgi:hypothetical protein